MTKETLKAEVSQHLDVSIEVKIENGHIYCFTMPYGASYREAHLVTQEIAKVMVSMEETAKKQQEEKDKDAQE